jgi:hypothetical protein
MLNPDFFDIFHVNPAPDMGTVSAEGGFWSRTGRFFVWQKKYRCDRTGFLRKFFRYYVATKKPPQPTSAGGFLRRGRGLKPPNPPCPCLPRPPPRTRKHLWSLCTMSASGSTRHWRRCLSFVAISFGRKRHHSHCQAETEARRDETVAEVRAGIAWSSEFT